MGTRAASTPESIALGRAAKLLAAATGTAAASPDARRPRSKADVAVPAATIQLRPGHRSFPSEPVRMPPPQPTPTVEQLVRRLVERLAVDGSGKRPGAAREDRVPRVILDLEVEGVRCVLIREPDAPSADPDQRAALSPREMEIVRMIAQGHPNKTIARVLEISTWTVGTHLRRVFAKLGVSSRAAMVANLSRADVFHQPLITPR